MLNPKVRESYTPEIVNELDKLATLYQREGRKIIVSEPTPYRNMLIPKYLFVEGSTWEDIGRAQNIVFNILDDHMKRVDDYPVPLACEMSWYDSEDAKTGLMLWV